MNEVISLLKEHRSIRKFTDQPVTQDIINEIVSAGQAAATSSFIQACTVIQVNDPARRTEIAAWAGGQAYVEEAPVFLVFCADMNRHQIACDMHEAPMQSGFTEQFLTASLDCGLFAQNSVVAAESLGLGIVYIGGIRNKTYALSEALCLPKMVYPVFGLCLGYPDQSPEVKPRLPLELVLKQDVYSNEGDVEALKEYDKDISHYYATRTGGQKDMTWTEQISGMLNKEARPHMKDFLKSKGFLEK